MEIIGHFKRRPVFAVALFFFGAFNAWKTVWAMADDSGPGVSSGTSDLTLSLYALGALVGIVGSLLTMMAGLLKRRESLARHELIGRVRAVEERLEDFDDRHATIEARLAAIGRDVSEVRREAHDRDTNQERTMSAMRSDLSTTMNHVHDLTEMANETLMLLRGMTK